MATKVDNDFLDTLKSIELIVKTSALTLLDQNLSDESDEF